MTPLHQFGDVSIDFKSSRVSEIRVVRGSTGIDQRKDLKSAEALQAASLLLKTIRIYNTLNLCPCSLSLIRRGALS